MAFCGIDKVCGLESDMDDRRNAVKQGENCSQTWMTGNERRTNAFFLILTAAILLNSVLKLTMNGDDYFMIANWREFLKKGFYFTDPLSMHSNYRCSLEKWMSCAAVWFLYTRLGLWGLKAAVAVLDVLIAYFLYRLCFYTSGNKFISWIFTDLMLATGSGYLQIRPQTVTTLLLILEALCLEHYIREGRKQWLIFLPVFAWFEMQIHSTIWTCFYLVLLPYLADMQWVDHRPAICWRQKRELVITGIISFAVLFLNPYGSWSVFYVFRYYGSSEMSSLIGELRLTNISMSECVIWLLVLGISLALGDKKMPLRYYLLYLGFYAFSWTARRNMIFICLLGGFVPCYMMRRYRAECRWNLLPAAPLIFILSVITGINSYVGVSAHALDAEIPAINWLSQNNSGGSIIYCDFNSGSYAEYLGFHPYADTRSEIYLKKVNGVEDLLTEYLQMTTGSMYYRDFIDKYHFDYLVVSPYTDPGFYTNLKHDTDFKVIYEDDEYSIFQECT